MRKECHAHCPLHIRYQVSIRHMAGCASDASHDPAGSKHESQSAGPSHSFLSLLISKKNYFTSSILAVKNILGRDSMGWQT